MTKLNFQFRHFIGLLFILYAYALIARPFTGGLGYVADVYNLSPFVVIFLFLGAATLLISFPLTPPAIAACTLPLILLDLATIIHTAQYPTIPWSAALGHTCFILTIWWWVARRVRSGDDA